MTLDPIVRALEDILRAIGGLLAPQPAPEPRPIPVRADDRPHGRRR